MRAFDPASKGKSRFMGLGMLASALLVLAAFFFFFTTIQKDLPQLPAKPPSSSGSLAQNQEPALSKLASPQQEVAFKQKTLPARPTPLPTLPPEELQERLKLVPASLQGTEIDGGFTVDEQGHLIPTSEALAFFDYFLSLQGEEPMDLVYLRMQQEIRLRLPQGAAEEALKLLDTYLKYKESAALEADVSEPELAWERIHVLRTEFFGDVAAQKMFGEEEAEVQDALARKRIMQNAELSEAQRNAALQELSDKLPPRLRQARQETLAPLVLAQEEQKLREQSASAEEIFDLRKKRVGEEAARRLAALDAARADWKARMEAYHKARAGVTETDQLQALRLQFFAEEDLPLVEFEDRQAGLP